MQDTPREDETRRRFEQLLEAKKQRQRPQGSDRHRPERSPHEQPAKVAKTFRLRKV